VPFDVEEERRRLFLSMVDVDIDFTSDLFFDDCKR
jgi:hypothetical protein